MDHTQEWRADPFGRHELRYFANGRPTTWVSSRGQVREDVISPLPPVAGSGFNSTPVSPATQVTEASGAPRLAQSAAVAGWYPDSVDAQMIRYWDGARWTEDTASRATDQSTIAGRANPKRPRRSSTMWIGAVLGLAIIAAITVLVMHRSSQKTVAAKIPSSTTTSTTAVGPTTTTAPVLTEAQQVTQWWSSEDGKTAVQSFTVDLIAIEQHWSASDVPGEELACGQLHNDFESYRTANVLPLSVQSLETEWNTIQFNIQVGSQTCSEVAPDDQGPTGQPDLNIAIQLMQQTFLPAIDPFIGVQTSPG